MDKWQRPCRADPLLCGEWLVDVRCTGLEWLGECFAIRVNAHDFFEGSEGFT